jgi:hypothetical protein
VTRDVVPALQFQIGLLDEEADALALIRRTGAELASTDGAAYSLSPLSFVSSRSNLGASDVPSILEAFGTKNGWWNIDSFAQRVGLAAPRHQEAFRSSLTARNHAAHRAAADTGTTELEAFYKHAIGIAISFDALLSRGTHIIRKSMPLNVQHDQIKIRFIEQHGSGWRDRAEGKSRAAERNDDREVLVRNALMRANPTGQLVVVRDEDFTPMSWATSDPER